MKLRRNVKGKNRRRHQGRDDCQCQNRYWPRHRHHVFDHDGGGQRFKAQKGDEAYAIIKASEIIVGKD